MMRFGRLGQVGGRSVATMALVGATGGMFAGATPAPADPGNTIVWTDTTQAFTHTVLAGTCSVSLDVRSADGGEPAPDLPTENIGGKGGRVLATFATTPGDVLGVSVGGRGGDGTEVPRTGAGSPGVTGGVPRGGAGGADTLITGYVAAGGGGLSMILLNGSAHLAAAGGGGAAGGAAGGNGGPAGAPGESSMAANGGGGGGAATTSGSSPGAAGGGNAGEGGLPAGGTGAGTAGTDGSSFFSAGGGGGAGVYAGGGGGNQDPNNGGAGGGGGANYVDASGTAITNTTGPGGSGRVAATFNPCVPAAGAPANLAAADGDEAAVLTFGEAPANGGTVTGYELSADGGANWATLSTTDNLDGTRTGTKAGLTAKNTYQFQVRAQGSGCAGTPSAQLTYVAAAVPAAPGDATAVPGDGQVTLTFAEADGMGRPVLSYQWRPGGPGPWTALDTTDNGDGTRTGTVAGLTNGVTAWIQLRAVNVIGDGAAGGDSTSVPQAPPVPQPLAPTDLAAAAGNAEARLTFTAPADNAGGAVLRYEYQINSTGAWTTLTTSAAGGELAGTVAGLSNGVTYAVRVRAVSAQGAGAEAGPAEVTPVAGAPGAPAVSDFQMADGSVDVTIRAPADDGGDPITGYEFQLDGGLGWNAVTILASDGDGCLFGNLSPLTAGTTYDVRVRAINGTGPGTPSAAETVVGVSAPGAPSAVVADPGDTSTIVTFTPPAEHGGVITGYEISLDDGANWTVWGPLPTTGGTLGGTVTGLVNDQTYAVRVRAVNQYGTGPQSAADPVTPHGVPPGAPTDLSGVPGAGAVSLSFTVPADPGSSAITGYDVSTDDGAHWVTATFTGTGATRTATVTGLTVGATYSIRVRARSAQGPGEQSAAYAFTAVGAPAAPALTSADPGDGRAVLTFTPGSTNGSPATDYEATVDNGATWDTLAAGAAPGGALYGLLEPLTNGTPYTVRVRALNVYGPGAPSAGLTVTPMPAPPGTPTGLTVAPLNGGLLLRFAPPAGAGDATYQASTDEGEHWSGLVVTPSFNKVAGLVTGLTNGTTYAVRVRAVNDTGTGNPTAGVPGRPLAPPAAPSSVIAVAGTSSVRLSWTAPIAGNAPVTGYTVTASPGPATCQTMGLSCLLGAEAGVQYTYRVVAHSASGDAPTAAVSTQVRPAMPIPPFAVPDGAFQLNTTGLIGFAKPFQEVTLVGYGYIPYSSVLLAFFSDPIVLGTVVTGAGGAFQQTVTVPAGVDPGTHTFLAQGVDADGNERFLSLEVRVAADDPVTPGQPGPPLPTTGGSPWMAGMLGMLLIVLGATLRVSAARPLRARRAG